MFNPILADRMNIDAGSPVFEVMMLAPWVVAMRMPNLLYEVATPWHATGGRRGGEGEKALVEKTAVAVESFGIIQAELMSSWSEMVTSAMLGNYPDVARMSRSAQDIADAGMMPMAKRVRANYARLKKRAAN